MHFSPNRRSYHNNQFKTHSHIPADAYDTWATATTRTPISRLGFRFYWLQHRCAETYVSRHNTTTQYVDGVEMKQAKYCSWIFETNFARSQTDTTYGTLCCYWTVACVCTKKLRNHESCRQTTQHIRYSTGRTTKYGVIVMPKRVSDNISPSLVSARQFPRFVFNLFKLHNAELLSIHQFAILCETLIHGGMDYRRALHTHTRTTTYKSISFNPEQNRVLTFCININDWYWFRFHFFAVSIPRANLTVLFACWSLSNFVPGTSRGMTI